MTKCNLVCNCSPQDYKPHLVASYIGSDGYARCTSCSRFSNKTSLSNARDSFKAPTYEPIKLSYDVHYNPSYKTFNLSNDVIIKVKDDEVQEDL